MIISSNREPNLKEFQSLVTTATLRLNDDAKKRAKYYVTRNAQKLEDDVFAFLEDTAKGTKFEKTIEKISGQKFPDIVVSKYYGVEVKSSKDEKWTSLGGSVNESTRVKDVERIFLTFGKLVDPIEFRSRPYEECLSEVVATHYPRYKIDMKLNEGETIFDKMEISSDALRTSENPVGKIVEYYKGQLKEGESLWWIDNASTTEENVTASIKVRLWSSLSRKEKTDLTTSLYSLFPDILSTENNRKYGNAVLWLASRHGIVDPSFRDKFSAGGQATIITAKGTFKELPKVFENIQCLATDIRLQINAIPKEILLENWEVSKIENDRLFQWIDIVSAIHRSDKYDVSKVLKAIFGV